MVGEMVLWGSSPHSEADVWHSWRNRTMKMLRMKLRGLAQV